MKQTRMANQVNEFSGAYFQRAAGGLARARRGSSEQVTRS
jgi:hypothetical protein